MARKKLYCWATFLIASLCTVLFGSRIIINGNDAAFELFTRDVNGSQRTALGSGSVSNQPMLATNRPLIQSLEMITQSGKRYVLHGFKQRLGNLMLQYAALRATAENYNASAVIPVSLPLRQVFNLDAVTVTDDVYNDLIYTYKRYGREEKGCCRYDGKLFEGMFEKRQLELFFGYMGSLLYFQSQEDRIRKEFSFLPHILANARGRLQEAQQWMDNQSNKSCSNVTFVGMHIRHGDIAHEKKLRQRGHSVVTKEYMFKAAKYFRGKYSNVLFVVASDDMPWVKGVFNWSKQSHMYFLTPGPPEVDMATLTLCNHTIASTGTFSWWIAFLTNGETVYYKNWPAKGSSFDRDMNKDQFFPKTWIFME